MTTSIGFHDGELAVQLRAGVRELAARLSGMVAPARLGGGVHGFLAERDLAILTARDREGRLWISPLAGSPGFLDGADDTLRIQTGPATGDPLVGLPDGQPAGVLVIDFARRRRIRINGTLIRAVGGELEITVDQAFGNCPQYIHRQQSGAGTTNAAAVSPARWSHALNAEQTSLIERADTFFLGTTHPERGNDASHRGGPPGFVRVEGKDLTWPDYPGNNIFSSLGNLAVDDAAALLFVDFIGGSTLHLSGRACLEWAAPASNVGDGGTGRRIRFTPRDVVSKSMTFSEPARTY